MSGSASGQSAALVALGRIVKAHGILGEVRVRRYHEASSLLRDAAEVSVAGRSLVVTGARAAGDADLLALAGVGTREEAEALLGAEVCVPRSALNAPSPDPSRRAILVRA